MPFKNYCLSSGKGGYFQAGLYSWEAIREDSPWSWNARFCWNNLQTQSRANNTSCRTRKCVQLTLYRKKTRWERIFESWKWPLNHSISFPSNSTLLQITRGWRTKETEICKTLHGKPAGVLQTTDHDQNASTANFQMSSPKKASAHENLSTHAQTRSSRIQPVILWAPYWLFSVVHTWVEEQTRNRRSSSCDCGHWQTWQGNLPQKRPESNWARKGYTPWFWVLALEHGSQDKTHNSVTEEYNALAPLWTAHLIHYQS